MLNPALIARRRRAGGNPLAAYAAGGKIPPTVLDFENDKYLGTVTALSDLDFAATTNRTVIDSDGVLKWGTHNLNTYSDDLNSWSKSLVTVTANAVQAPTGEWLDAVVETDGGSGRYRITTANTNTTIRQTVEVVAKAGTRQYLIVKDSNNNGVTFDLVNGSVGSPNGSNYVAGSASIKPLGDGVYLCSFDANPLPGVLFYIQAATVVSIDDVYSGVSGDVAFYAGAVRRYRSDLGGMQNNPLTGDSYVPTTTAAVYMPRFDYATGARRLLIEPTAATNLVGYSGNPSNVAWSNTGITVGSKTDGGVAGSYYPLTVPGTTTVGIYQIAKAITSGSNYCSYIIAKAGTGDPWVTATVYDTTAGDRRAWFNLSTGTKGSADAGVVDYDTVDLGDGWYLCWCVATAASTSGGAVFHITDGDGQTSTADAGDVVLFAGAQFEAGSVPTSYIPTAGATATRAAETLAIPAAKIATYTTAVGFAMSGEVTGQNVPLRWYVDASNYITQTINGDGDVVFEQASAGTVDNAESTTAYTLGVNVPFSIAGRHGSTFVQGAADGTANTANTTPTAIMDGSATDIQLAYSGGPMRIEKFTMWAEDYSQTGLEEASA